MPLTSSPRVLVKHKGYILQQVVNHVGEAFAGLVKNLFRARLNLPRFGQEIDSAVGQYIDTMEMWVVGYLDWSLARKRYFGQTNEEIKRTRIVKLYPRKFEL